MPREIVHWQVCSTAISRLISRGELNFEINWCAAFIGAIAHDSPYYLLGKSKVDFSGVAESLHGSSGEDTYEPLRNLIELSHSLKSEREISILKSFIFGFASHLVTDTVFHPAIIYLTGDYYDKDEMRAREARTQHRALETALDIAFGILPSKLAFSPLIISHLREFYRSAGSEFRERIFSCLVLSNDVKQNCNLWERSFEHLAWLQIAFRSNFCGRIARLLAQRIPRLREYAALFKGYTAGSDLTPSLEFLWRHPITGDEFNSSWIELESQAILQTEKLLGEIIAGDLIREVPQTLKGYGPSLSYSIPRITKDIDLILAVNRSY